VDRQQFVDSMRTGVSREDPLPAVLGQLGGERLVGQDRSNVTTHLLGLMVV
jgi:hypothetical protein